MYYGTKSRRQTLTQAGQVGSTVPASLYLATQLIKATILQSPLIPFQWSIITPVIMYFTNPYALPSPPPKPPARQPISITLARVVAQFAAAGVVTAKANAKIAAIKAEIARGDATTDTVTRGKATIATIEAGVTKLNATMDALEARVCVRIKKFATKIIAVRAITAGLGCAGRHCAGTGGAGREVEVSTTTEPMASSTSR